MQEKKLTYSEAVEIVTQRMQLEKGKLRGLCLKHEVNYNVALEIKNGKAKRQYPTVVLNLLRAFKYKAELKKEVYYTIKPH